MMSHHSRTPRGFTLIEIMMVTAIIGALASVAMPEYQHLIMRTKLAERRMLMMRIKQGAQDAFSRSILPTSGNVTGPATPATVPGVTKLMPNWGQADWNVLFASLSDIDGAVYYQYSYTEREPAGMLTIVATGDLDGDGVPAVKSCTYQRVNGAYQIDPNGLPGTGCVCQPGGAAAVDCEPEDYGFF